MKTMISRTCVWVMPVLSLVAVAAFVGLTALGLKSAAAACTIGWEVGEPTCDDANNGDGTFSFNLVTSWTNYQQDDWTMYTAFTSGNSPNIVNGSVTPNHHDILISNPNALESGLTDNPPNTNGGSLAT